MIPDYSALAPQTAWRRMPTAVERLFASNPNAIWFGAFLQPVARDPLKVLVSVDLLEDLGQGIADGHWLHLSISRAKRLPTWGDLCTARDALGYKERLFVQLVPPASAWLNMHSHCLHLLHRLDDKSVPDLLWNQVGTTGTHYGKPGSLK